MSKQLRGVLIAAAVLVAAAVTYAVLLSTLGKGTTEETASGLTSSDASSDTPSGTPSDDNVLRLYEYDSDSFVSAEITPLSGKSYRVERDGDTYFVPGLEAFSCYKSNIKLCADRLCAYPYSTLVTEHVTETEKETYGFLDPTGKAAVTLSDGTAFTLLVGARTDDGLYYVMREGNGTVVLASTGITSYFLRGEVSFLQSNFFSCAEDRRNGVDNFVLTDRDAKYPVMIQKTDGDRASALALSTTYSLIYPASMSVDSEKLDEGLKALSHFAGEGAIEIVSESTDLSVYGLDDPRFTLSFTYQKPLADDDISEINPNPIETHRFLISDTDETGLCYVLSEDGRVVHYFTAGAYPFMAWTLENMAGTTFLSPMIKTLDRMTLRYGGRDFAFLFTEGDGSISAVNYEGRQLDVDNFKKFYQVVLGTGWIGMGEKAEGAEPYLTVTFDYHDDLQKENDVMTFYPYSLRQYAVEINGKGGFTSPKTRLDKVVSDLYKVINNETVTAFLN